MKRLLCYTLLPCLLLGSTRVPPRCQNCDKKKDEMPAVMAQTFFNILINGFIATQSSSNKEQQNTAVVNALSSLSHFVQTFVKKNEQITNRVPADHEALLSAFEEYLRDPLFLQLFLKELASRSNKLKILAVLEH